jgi:AcrR family transcriptional regulator
VEAILQAAGELIAAEGYAAMTTNRIARRAGVSIGSLYQYFPNKATILVELLERHRASVRPAIEASLAEQADPTVPFAEAMRRLFHRLQALHADNPRLQRALAEEVPHPPHVREREQRRDQGYVWRVAQILKDRPDVQVENPLAAAQVLVQATGALAHWISHAAPAATDRDAYIEEAVRLLTAYAVPGRRGA